MIALYLNIVNKVSKIQGKLFFHYSKKDHKLCDLFCLAPQTEIPLTGEMSRSDKRVTARYEQLEPATPRLTGTVKKSRKPYVSRDLHIALTTSDDVSNQTVAGFFKSFIYFQYIAK